MRRFLKYILSISIFKTLRINFHYFPFFKALKFPIFVSRHTKILKLGGEVNCCCLFKTGMIRVGFDRSGLIDSRYERAIWEVSGILEFHGNASFGSATKIIVFRTGKIIFGKDISVTGRSSFIVEKEVSIGNNSIISWEVQIMDTDLHKIIDSNERQINESKPIIIGDNVWIGSRCNILKGSVVPDGSIIASNSLVSRKLLEKRCIYGGSPLKIIKTDINWEH